MKQVTNIAVSLSKTDPDFYLRMLIGLKSLFNFTDEQVDLAARLLKRYKFLFEANPKRDLEGIYQEVLNLDQLNKLKTPYSISEVLDSLKKTAFFNGEKIRDFFLVNPSNSCLLNINIVVS